MIKKGDKLTVRENLTVGETYGGSLIFTEDMDAFKAKTVTVDHSGGRVFTIEGSDRVWHKDMVRLPAPTKPTNSISELRKSKLKSGHIVELEDKSLCIVMVSEFVRGEGFLFDPITSKSLLLTNYLEDLTIKEGVHSYSVAKVYEPLLPCISEGAWVDFTEVGKMKLIMQKPHEDEVYFVINQYMGVERTLPDIKTKKQLIALDTLTLATLTEISGSYFTDTHLKAKYGRGINAFSDALKPLLITEMYQEKGLFAKHFTDLENAEKYLTLKKAQARLEHEEAVNLAGTEEYGTLAYKSSFTEIKNALEGRKFPIENVGEALYSLLGSDAELTGKLTRTTMEDALALEFRVKGKVNYMDGIMYSNKLLITLEKDCLLYKIDTVSLLYPSKGYIDNKTD